MRAAIYIRVSTARQAVEGLSLAAQENLLRGYCQQNGLEVVALYADEGISAKDTKHRPAFLRMMADAEQDKFNVIVIWKLSRFSRSCRDLLNCIQQLDKHGVGLKSYSEPIDTTSAVGIMTTTILAAMAQFERDIISDNVKMVASYRARENKRTCNCVLGYDLLGKDSLVQNPKEAEVVRCIFDTFLSCRSFTQTAAVCAQKQYRGKRGAQLQPWHIERILICPVHAGYYSFLGDVFKGEYEPIVTVDTYNRVQSIIASYDAQRGRRRKRPLIMLDDLQNNKEDA